MPPNHKFINYHKFNKLAELAVSICRFTASEFRKISMPFIKILKSERETGISAGISRYSGESQFPSTLEELGNF